MNTRADVDSLSAGAASATLSELTPSEVVVKRPDTKSGFVATVVIPAYNEEKGLPVVLQRLFACVDGQCEVLVVDDGSSDATPQVASRFRCGVVRHSQNRGKGEAMLTGARHARGKNVIFIDADGTYPPEAIPQMVQILECCEAVYCARSTGRHNIPLMNRLGNAAFQAIMKYGYGFHASDYSTGLYGIRKHQLQRMNICSRGFAIEPEIAIKVSRMNLGVREIPIHYEERIGKSKLSGLQVGWQHLRIMLKLATWHPGPAGKMAR
ncbi:MAG: glycosyltransferase family 2 protein [Dehalococcoidia bacterium]|nr:glycosyltransferase family 2 protein [Dehalococcoidia bacterium]